MEDLDFMKDPNRWPNWPFLPLKHSTKRDAIGFPVHGVLKEVEIAVTVSCGPLRMSGTFEFYENCNIFMMNTKTEPDAVGGQELLERIVSQGWIVD